MLFLNQIETMGATDLSTFNNRWYKIGASYPKQIAWYFVNVLFFKSGLNPISSLKVTLLRAFGAKIGYGVVIKPSVNIKYPWKLSIGDYTWIGEEVWIDNLDQVTIGSHCCLSQGALLLCGSHNYTESAFGLKIKPITLEDGVWIGAKSVVLQGVRCYSHSILSASSVAAKDLEAYTIYRGNPALKTQIREIIS